MTLSSSAAVQPEALRADGINTFLGTARFAEPRTIDVFRASEAQTDGLFRVSDLRPVRHPHPTCSACTYALINEGEIIPIPRIVNVDEYLDLVTNRTVPIRDLSVELKADGRRVVAHGDGNGQ